MICAPKRFYYSNHAFILLSDIIYIFLMYNFNLMKENLLYTIISIWLVFKIGFLMISVKDLSFIKLFIAITSVMFSISLALSACILFVLQNKIVYPKAPSLFGFMLMVGLAFAKLLMLSYLLYAALSLYLAKKRQRR
jgi:hypothetical protein